MVENHLVFTVLSGRICAVLNQLPRARALKCRFVSYLATNSNLQFTICLAGIVISCVGNSGARILNYCTTQNSTSSIFLNLLLRLRTILLVYIHHSVIVLRVPVCKHAYDIDKNHRIYLFTYLRFAFLCFICISGHDFQLVNSAFLSTISKTSVGAFA